MFDFLVVNDVYILQYIIEPNKFVYFFDIDNKVVKLKCTSSRNNAKKFVSREDAILCATKIKDLFGLEFQVIKEE